MIQGVYKIAGQVLELHTEFALVHEMCRTYGCGEAPDFRITTTPADVEYERKKSRREDLAEGIAPRQFPDDYLETLAVYRKLADELLSRNILLFHGSAVAVDGAAYLFSATSGTGKSTHTRMWREVFGDRAVMINDDKPLLQIGSDEIRICGTPWNGKHGLGTNQIAPLRAICMLERGLENRIVPISPQEILPFLLQQSHRPTDPGRYGLYLGLLEQLMQKMPFYRMQCTISHEAAMMAYETMNSKGES